MAVSLLLVVGVCWNRGDEPSGTVTALPPDFTTAAHPAGSGTGTAALAGAPGAGARPGIPDAGEGAASGTPGTGKGAASVTPGRTVPPGTPGATKAAPPGAPAPRVATHPPRSTAPGSHPRTPPPRAPATPKADARATAPRAQGPRPPRSSTPGLRKGSPAHADRPAAAAPHPAPRRAAPAARKPRPPAGLRPLPRSRATRLLIPYLRLDAPVMDLGLDRDRRLTAPPDDDPELVGWYRHGPSPGEQGTAVAVGHLDTDSGPAVFAGLTELRRGRIIKARRADGRTAVYTVDKIKSYEKADFPSQEVYGARGRPELRLITCGGSYDRRKGYSGNLVVFAHLTGVR
ncbi:class F sortase [Streptomyces sp. NPDC050698]